MTTTVPSAKLARSLAAAAAAALTLAACDPPPAEDLLLGPQKQAPFAVERTSLARGAPAADGVVSVRFTQPLDPRSVGTRGVRVTHGPGERSLRVRVWAADRQLHVAPLPGREFPADSAISLRIEGGVSPRAIRSAAGETLARPFRATFRAVSRRVADLVGPRVVASQPAHGADDVPPGGVVEVRFSEPLARGPVATGEAATLRVDGVPVAARLALSEDRTVLVVRPAAPIPPDHVVEVEVQPHALDAAGNPLDPESPRRLEFRTRATSLHEIAEDFLGTDTADLPATSCAWDDPLAPGFLTARTGPVLLAAADPSARPAVLAEAPHVRFQLVFPGSELPRGFASALRLELDAAPQDARLFAAVVEAGPTVVDERDPSFTANRAAATLFPVARVADPVAAESGEKGRSWVEIPFEEPVRLEPGRSLLLDVRLDLSPGVRLAAAADTCRRALVEGAGGVTPVAALLASSGAPTARSAWYDSGAQVPGWRGATVVRADSDEGVSVVAEYQSAPAGPDGRVDPSRASPWSAQIERLPAFRFVRFRLRFEGWSRTGEPPRVDRVVMPYEL